VTFSAGELASAVRRAALMTNQTSRGIVMALEAGKAVFSNLNYTNGSVRIPVACDYNGLTCKLGLNAQYLSDVLKVWSKDRIDIEISRGLVMREPGVTYLIMPISLPG
jgi:DNA polymerase III sliding clamp (beta) subunit (PCNA family)